MAISGDLHGTVFASCRGTIGSSLPVEIPEVRLSVDFTRTTQRVLGRDVTQGHSVGYGARPLTLRADCVFSFAGL
jgi:hypothetical protein